MTNLQWDQTKLPVSMGGFGLRAALDHVPAAYAISYLSSQPEVEEILGQASSVREGNSQPEDQVEEQRDEEGPAEQSEGPSRSSLQQPLLTLLSASMGEEATIDSMEGASQKETSFDQNNYSILSNRTRDSGVREVERLGSVKHPHAGDWLNVVPCPALGLHLRSPEFIVAGK